MLALDWDGDMSIKVFISKGSTATEEQRAFVDAVLEMLDTVGIDARIMYENEWSHEQPLKAIRKIISECNGAVVIAFTRTQFDKGIELKKDKVVPIQDIKLPTTWNHIEASLAYANDLPLLVIAENGLKSEGLIENGYNWRVYWTDMAPEVVKSDSFRGFLRSWKTSIEENIAQGYAKEIVTDPSKISIGKLLKMLSLPQLWKLMGVMATVLTLVAGGSYKLGAGKWPWQGQISSAETKIEKNGPNNGN